MTAGLLGGHLLRVTGPAAALSQVKLIDPRYVARSEHELELVVGEAVPLPVTIELLEALRDVLTLPCASSIDFALALDWTKIPQDGMDPRSWPNTDIYELVTKGKYQFRNPTYAAEQAQTGRAIARRLSDYMEMHPLLRNADVVAAVPGHDSRVQSFGGRLAATVAAYRSVTFVPCRSATEFRTPAKDLDPAGRAAAIANQFICDRDLNGLTAVVVDDVYRSGTTAAEAARAMRLAGVARVAVLVPARTMRS